MQHKTKPTLNALLLTSEINRLNEPTRARWRKKLVKRVEEKYGHLKQDQVLDVTVWLSEDAVSTQSGAPSKIHAFPATWARVDGSRTIFLDEEGEIYADWPTEIAQEKSVAPAHSRWIVVDNCAHVIMWNYPELTVELIKKTALMAS